MYQVLIAGKRGKSFLIIALCLMAVSLSAYAGIQTKEIVKLYSDGKLVDTWEAIEPGRMEGPCYVFKIRKGAFKPKVRVCGTFSVEEVQ
jgi:hypothetical protein